MSQVPMVEGEVARYLPSYVKAELGKLDLAKQQEFLEEFNRKKKSIGLAYLCWFFGLHYAYLKQWGLLAVFWLALLVLLGIAWWIIDAFRLPTLIENYNKDVAIGVMREMKLIGSGF